ncbi:hypothetical protein B0I35DRAFT_362001, partial [Stachybotrys elegans]
TVRVQGVPLGWDKNRLAIFLTESFGTVPTIKSLAQEVQGGVQSATASFQTASDVPKLPMSIKLPTLSKEEASRPASLQVDNNFYGVTTLFIPKEADDRVDVIALPGLGGHAFESFKHPPDEYMGLRDTLPQDLTNDATGQPMARVMTFGYESGVAGSNLEGLATRLHHSLLPLVATPIARPVIFVAHGFGGLVLKQALVSLSKLENEKDHKLLQAGHGFLFFGIPHAGMDKATQLACHMDLVAQEGRLPRRR